MKQRLESYFLTFLDFRALLMVGRHTMTKRSISPLFQTYHKIVKSIISKGYSSTLRTKRILKIQNPIRIKDFMVKYLFKYRFTEKQTFSVFILKGNCLLIQFFKTIC